MLRADGLLSMTSSVCSMMLLWYRRHRAGTPDGILHMLDAGVHAKGNTCPMRKPAGRRALRAADADHAAG